jgi:hypothetical protein
VAVEGWEAGKKKPRLVAGAGFGVLRVRVALVSDRSYLSHTGWRGNKKYEYEQREPGGRSQLDTAQILRQAGGLDAGGAAIHVAEQNTHSPNLSTADLALGSLQFAEGDPCWTAQVAAHCRAGGLALDRS